MTTLTHSLTGTASKRWVLTRDEATKLLTYYPNDPALGCPYGWGNVTWPKLGLEYKRYESMAGDITMVAPRRMLAQAMSRYEDHVYSYRWDVAALNTSTNIGVQHFAEVRTLGLICAQIYLNKVSEYCRLDLLLTDLIRCQRTDPVRLRKSSPEYHSSGIGPCSLGTRTNGGSHVDFIRG